MYVGSDARRNEVGVIPDKNMKEQVIRVDRVSGRLMLLVIILNNDVLNITLRV